MGRESGKYYYATGKLTTSHHRYMGRLAHDEFLWKGLGPDRCKSVEINQSIYGQIII